MDEVLKSLSSFCCIRYLLQFCRRGAGGVPPKDTPLPNGVMEDDDAHIDINSKNMAGATPLELAASQGHTEVVKYVLPYKGNWHLVTSPV